MIHYKKPAEAISWSTVGQIGANFARSESEVEDILAAAEDRVTNIEPRLVHIEVPFQNPLLEMVRCPWGFRGLLNRWFDSSHTGRPLIALCGRRGRIKSRSDRRRPLSPRHELFAEVEAFTYKSHHDVSHFSLSERRNSCSGLEDKPPPPPRPATLGEEPESLEDLPLRVPGPPLTSRSAFAPKLIRRAKGVVGELLAGASPSSMALSSAPGDAEAVLEQLSWRPRRLPKGEVWVGEPERPRVEMDMRRRWWAWALAAAAAMGPG